MKPNVTSKNAATDLTDWARVDATGDAEIDLSEHPEWTDERFSRAKRRGPQKTPIKEPVSIRLSPEVVAYFKAGGPGWQTRIDAALRAYVDAQREAAA